MAGTTVHMQCSYHIVDVFVFQNDLLVILAKILKCVAVLAQNHPISTVQRADMEHVYTSVQRIQTYVAIMVCVSTHSKNKK